jgi:hypothetical protein
MKKVRKTYETGFEYYTYEINLSNRKQERIEFGSKKRKIVKNGYYKEAI